MAEEGSSNKNAAATPRDSNNAIETTAGNNVKLMSAQPGGRNLGLCRGLSYHASELIQFYTPIFALCKSTTLPNYVIMSQLLLRIVLIATLAVAASFIYLNFALED